MAKLVKAMAMEWSQVKEPSPNRQNFKVYQNLVAAMTQELR